MSIFVAGLDLGQMQDYTALVVIEAHGTFRKVTGLRDPETGLLTEAMVEMMPLAQVDVRHIERFKLGLKYAEVAAMMRTKIRAMPHPGYFCLDNTGVGRAVSEYYEEFRPIKITATSGREAVCVGPLDYHVPKRDLIEPAQVLMQNGAIRISKKMEHAELLASELLAFKMKISKAGNDTYEAWREKDHDDLVFALAIACWTAALIVSQGALARLQGPGEDPPSISPF